MHQNYAIKHVDHHARLRVKRRACLPRFLRSIRQNSPCSRNARAYFAKSYGSFTTSLMYFENCFSVYDQICVNCKFDPIYKYGHTYAQYKMRSAILRNHFHAPN